MKYTGTWFENNWTKQTRSLNSDGCIILYTGRQWEEKNYLYPLPSEQTQARPEYRPEPRLEIKTLISTDNENHKYLQTGH